MRRLEEILDIVRSRSIYSQGELVEALGHRGWQTTQATVSRDVRHLGLAKVSLGSGRSRYVEPAEMERVQETSERGLAELRRALRRSALSVETGGALLVITTPSGHANAAAVALDEAHWPEIIGTLAGDDTVLIVLRDATARDQIHQAIDRLIE